MVRFIVDVVSRGAGGAKKQLNDVADATNKVANASNTANNAASQHFDTQAKGVIGTANSTRSFSKLAQTINGGGGSVVGAYATLAANVFAITAAFNALNSAAQFQQVELGLQALGDRTGRTLSIAAKGLREVTNNAISTEQAMRSTAQVFSAGFNSEQLERLGKVATDTSFALGRSMTDSMDRLTRGVIKLEPELLDELGIMTRIGDATASYAIQLGKSESALTTTERRQAFYNAVMAEGELKFGDLSKAAGNTKGLDQLAATFSDLSKQILNVINIAVLPLAQLFSNSPGALIGLAVLFAGTIRSQLLPGLTTLHTASLKNAESFREMAKGQASVVAEMDPASKALKGLNNLIASGDAELKHYQKGFASAGTAISKYTKELEQGYAIGDKTRKALSAAQIAYRKEQIDILQSYQGTLKRVINVEQQAAAHTQAANAIEAAGNHKLRDTLTNLNNAKENYRNSLIATQKAQQTTATGMTQLKTAAFAAGVGIRAAGAALLNAIPVIGQIIFAVGLLVAGYKALQNAIRSDAEKAYIKTMKELGEILETLDNKSKEYIRTVNSSGPAFLRQVQGMTLISNVASELSEKLEEANRQYVEMQKKASENRDNLSREAVRAQMDPGMAAASKALEAAYEAAAKKWSGIGKDSSFIDFRSLNRTVTNSAGFKTFKELYESEIPLMAKVAKESLKGMTLDEINAKPAAEQLKIFNGAARETLARLRELGPAAEQLSQAFKDADSAFGQFITSMAVNTPYDKAVEGMLAINKALNEQVVAASKAGLGMYEYVTALSGVGQNVTKFLSADSQKVLSQFRVDDSTVQRLESKPAAERTEQEKKTLAIAKNRLQTQQASMAVVGDELVALQNRFQALQEEERQGKLQLQLEQARLKALSSLYEVTSAGLKAQYEGEERIRSLQNYSITLRRQTNAMILDNNNLSAQELATLTELQRRRSELINLSLSDKSSERDKKNAQDQLMILSQLESRQQATAAARANDVNLQTESAILDEDRLTIGQQLARQLEREIAQRVELLRVQGETEAVLRSIAQIDAKYNRALAGRRTTLQDEVDDIKNSNTERRIALDLELKIARENTRGKLANAQADAARAQTAAEKAAAQSQVSRYELELLVAETRRESGMAAIAAEERLQIIEKANFDARVEGIQYQQQALQYLEKEYDLRKDILDSQNKVAESQTRLALRRRGLEATPDQEAAIEIRAARTQYNLAVQQAELRRSMIDLEFALLEGQRTMFREQLADRQRILASQGIGTDDPRMRTLSAALESLDNADLEGMKDLAQTAVRETLRASRSELDALLDPRKSVNSPANAILSGLAGVVNRIEESKAPINEVTERRKVFTEHANLITESITPVVTATNLVTDKLQAISDKLDVLVTQVSSTLATTATSARDAITQVGKNLQGRGFRVSEHPEFGGVGGMHRGRGHREGRAIDVNIGRGNREWNNPAMKARFDALKQELKAMGATVLWGVGGHFDHMHVEFKEGFTRVAEASEAIARATGEVPAQIAAAIQPAIANAAPQDITQVDDIEVTAKRAVAETSKAAKIGLQDYITGAEAIVNSYRSSLQDLGPQGELVLSLADGATTVAQSIKNAFEQFDQIQSNDKLSGIQKFGQSFAAAGQVASAALSSLSSIMAASSAAKVDMIDKEIAAEQARDGKSAESVAKIASLEKKKDAMQRKSFETNKKLQMAQAVVSTASGIAQALSSAPFPLNVALAAMIGGMGAAQLAIIAGTSYQSTASSTSNLSTATPTLAVGKRGDSVDLARNNANAGGEIGYLRGAKGYGRNAGDYAVIGSAYGGRNQRGYGNTGILVGEKGPEILSPDIPMRVDPVPAATGDQPLQPVEFHINALDAKGVEEILYGQRGHIIGMLREAANANGQKFLEDVNTNIYTKPNVGKL